MMRLCTKTQTFWRYSRVDMNYDRVRKNPTHFMSSIAEDKKMRLILGFP